MRRVIGLAGLTLTLLFGASPVGVARTQETVLFEDRFEQDLAEGWEWVRGRRRGRRVEGGRLHIRTRPGTLYEGANNGRNLVLRSLPEGGAPQFVEVGLSLRPEGLHENGGILLYVDDDNYVIVSLGAHAEGDDPLRVQLLHEISGRAEPQPWRPYEGDRVYLAMRLEADEVTGLYRRSVNDPWQELGSVPRPAATPRIGLQTTNGVAGAERWAQFSNFRITRPSGPR